MTQNADQKTKHYVPEYFTAGVFLEQNCFQVYVHRLNDVISSKFDGISHMPMY